MKIYFITLSLVILTLCIISSCNKSITEYNCDGITPTYNASIKAILDRNCAYSGCHAGSNPSEGIDLSTYEKAKNESLQSRFLGSIQHKTSYEPMPDNKAKLDDATIKQLSCWVQNGSPQ